MMEKNWLIRTKNNHILGPVSKAKVKELVENGSIRGDDEICSGNGFWFYARESDMLSKYLKNEEKQPFNPVSEADTVLALPEAISGEGDGAPKHPGGENAEYPDDITVVDMSMPDLGGEEEASESSGSGEQKKK